MRTLLQDIRFGLRILRSSRTFTATAVLTLAVCIGAVTALYSIVDGVLLRPLPFSHPEELVMIKADMPGIGSSDIGLAQPELVDLQKGLGVFQRVSSVNPDATSNLTGGTSPVRLDLNTTSTSYFALLGAKPQLGRVFDPSDYRDGFSDVILISDSLWRQRFGASERVLGKTIRLDTDPYTIVGVMAPDFHDPLPGPAKNEQIWLACGYSGFPYSQPNRNDRILEVIARLKGGVSISQAQSRLDAYARQVAAEFPTFYPADSHFRFRLIPLERGLVGDSSKMLYLLLSAVGALLLLACVNIASLLLARFAVRQQEMAIRLSLGAGPWRLVRQSITECLMISFLGGVIALPVAYAAKAALLRMTPSTLPRVSEIALSGRVFLFAFAVSMATGLLIGLAPAKRILDRRVALTAGSRTIGPSSRDRNYLHGLLVSEIALTFVLLLGTGLLLRSFWNVLQVQLGFEVNQLVAARVSFPLPNDPKNGPYPTQEKFNTLQTELIQRVRAIPGVTEVAIGSGNTGFTGGHWPNWFHIEGIPAPASEGLEAEQAAVTPEYFHALGIPLLRGRLFTEADGEKTEPVAIIDQATADRYWPHQDPIGKRIQFHFQAPEPWRRIVGIVGSSRNDGLEADYVPHIFRPMRQDLIYDPTVYVKTGMSPEAVEESIRRVLQEINPDLPIVYVRTVRDQISESLAPRRFIMQTLGFFAGTAIFLAAIGIYGVVGYVTSQRVREMGVRIALGATPIDILRLIIRQGVKVALAGITIGLLISAIFSRSIAGYLFHERVSDPVNLIVCAILLLAVAVFANFIPARRAAGTEAMVSLRCE